MAGKLNFCFIDLPYNISRRGPDYFVLLLTRIPECAEETNKTRPHVSSIGTTRPFSLCNTINLVCTTELEEYILKLLHTNFPFQHLKLTSKYIPLKHVKNLLFLYYQNSNVIACVRKPGHLWLNQQTTGQQCWRETLKLMNNLHFERFKYVKFHMHVLITVLSFLCCINWELFESERLKWLTFKTRLFDLLPGYKSTNFIIASFIVDKACILLWWYEFEWVDPT